MAVRINVVGKADLKEFDRAQKKLKAMRDEALKAQPGITGAMARAGDSMQRFGTKTTNVGQSLTRNLTVPLAAAAYGLVKFTQAAADDVQQQTVLANTLRNTADATDATIASTEKWITAQQKALGFSDSELRPALGVLASATKDVGKAQELAALAMDIAAARGISVETAAKGLSKAYAGNTGALSRLVPGIEAAAIASGDFTRIQEELANMVGGSASKAADTQAGRMKRSKEAMGEATEQIGNALLPVMEDLTAIITNNIVPAVEKFAEWFGKLSPRTRKIIVIVGALVAVLGPLLVVVGSVISAMGVIAGAFAAVSLPIIAVVAIIGAVIAIMVILYKKNETFRNFVLDMWRKITIGAAVFVDWFKGTAWPFIKAVFDKFTIGVKVLWTVWKFVFNAIWSFIKFVFNGIRATFAVFSAVLRGDWSKLWNMLKSVFVKLWSQLGPIAKVALDKVVGFVKGLGGRVKSALGKAKDWLLDAGKDLVTGLWNGVKSKWDWVKDKITSLGGSVISWAKKALGINSPSREFAKIGVGIGEGMRNGIQDSMGMVKSAALGLVNTASVSASLNLAGATASPALVGSASRTVTVAPGAVQVTINGSNASPNDTKQIVDAAFAKLVRELRAR